MLRPDVESRVASAARNLQAIRVSDQSVRGAKGADHVPCLYINHSSNPSAPRARLDQLRFCSSVRPSYIYRADVFCGTANGPITFTKPVKYCWDSAENFAAPAGVTRGTPTSLLPLRPRHPSLYHPFPQHPCYENALD